MSSGSDPLPMLGNNAAYYVVAFLTKRAVQYPDMCMQGDEIPEVTFADHILWYKTFRGMWMHLTKLFILQLSWILLRYMLYTLIQANPAIMTFSLPDAILFMSNSAIIKPPLIWRFITLFLNIFSMFKVKLYRSQNMIEGNRMLNESFIVRHLGPMCHS